MKNRCFVLALCFAVLVSAFPLHSVASPASLADAATEAAFKLAFEVRITALRTQFPNGKFWNHAVYEDNQRADVLLANWDNTYGDSISDTPCATHNGQPEYGQYDCNAFDGGIQCFGFANRIFYGIFGEYASKQSERRDIQNISVGDWIRVENDTHSAVVISRNNDILTIVEGNRDEHCKIVWDREINLNTVTYFKHASNYYEISSSTVSSDPTPVSIDSSVTVTWSTYTDKHWIGETNAVLAKRADLTGVGDGDVTKLGINLYDSDGKKLKSFSEDVSYGKDSYFLVWYDVNLSTELNYTLTHATTYQYEIFAVIKGETYFSPLESFKTTGSHSYDKTEVISAPTCGKDGQNKKICSCGAYVTESIPATGEHSWDAGVVTAPPTETEEGVMTYTCTVCGEPKTEKIPVVVKETVIGDINGDGIVNDLDLVRFIKFFADYDDATGASEVEIAIDCADCNGDGTVDDLDLTRLLLYFANYDDESGTSTVELG